MVKRIRTLLTSFLLVMGTMVSWAEFEDFAINLTEATANTGNPTLISSNFLPEGVEQIFYGGDRTAAHNGGQHGWQYAAFQFDVDGPVDIIIGGCQFSNVNATITDVNGTFSEELDTKSIGCGGVAIYKYIGEATTLKVYCGQYCPTIKVQKPSKENFEASWDWSKRPEALNKSINSSVGWLSADNGISIYVDAINSKLDGKDRDNAQFNNGARLLLPVYGANDVISVKPYPGYGGYSIHGDVYTGDVNNLKVSTADVEQGFIEIKSTGDNKYLSCVTLKHMESSIVPVAFESFGIDFRTNPYSFVVPTGHIPANVKVTGGNWHDEGISNEYNTLGYRRAVVRVDVDRPVKFTIGTSNDTDNATVSVNGGAATVIKTNFSEEGGICDGGPYTYNHNVKYVYEGTEPAVLVFNLGEFCPYFFAEEWVSPEYDETTKTFNVAEDNVEQLRNAIIKANTMGGNTTIYLPNGTYDLNSDINTEIKGDNIAIVGESRDGVIIKNSPTGQGLDRTATLKNTSTGLYLQNLTLQCDAKYDEKEKSEVGVALWDKGTKTICKNVCLKGRQGTYYSNGAEGMIAYFEGGKIEGAVDFICGSGNVLFNSVTLNVIATEHTQSGGCIAAPSTYSSENGYVFANCLVTAAGSQKDTYYLARGWQNSPAALFVLTKFAVDPSPEYWGRNIADLDSRRFAAHGTGAAYDANATSITKASLVNFASNWDPAFIISLHSPIKTNAAGWASYTAFTDVYLKGEDVKAYTAIQINKNSVLLKTIDDKVIPAGTAVFVKGAEETAYNVNGAVVGKAIGENYLKPVLFDTPLTSGQNAFVIGTRDGVCGLYLVNSDIVVPAGKCYLDAGEASLVLAKDELEIVSYDSEATGINNIDANTDADSFRYNLSGQKVGNGYKGIVVRKDGKKYMAK